MDKLNIYITLVIIFKIIFAFLAIYEVYLIYKNKIEKNKNKIENYNNKIEKIDFWKKRIEFVFIIMMSLLVIYLFNPRNNNIKLINNETKILLFIFGFILILTADWTTFISESVLLHFFSSKMF